MKMNPWTLSVLLLLAVALGADPDWHVEYPEPFCVVEGSTTTIPCSFTHPVVHKETGVKHQVKRVVWCPDHRICQGTTPSVYDSNATADSRFVYLGDLVRNCTLQIIKTEKRDAATYFFRIETNADQYAGPPGVRITVTNGEDVKVQSSITENVVKKGGQVTLTCTSACSFHQLDVRWSRNIHALSETGPALHLSDVTNCNTGNYTCSLDSSGQKTSAPLSLVVLEDEDGEDVKVQSSITENVVKKGGQVTLTCTSACSLHQLKVRWNRNGQALSETGPALHLTNLTNDDTGNYTCSLGSSGQKTSAPLSLVVLEDEGNPSSVFLNVAVVMGVLLAVFFLFLAGFVFAKRRHAQKKAPEVIPKQELASKQEVVGPSEEVSYSTVHFKHNSSRSARGPEDEIVYSEVFR